MLEKKRQILFITGKDLLYPPDRDGGVAFFENYIKYLVQTIRKELHYYTAIGYSGGEVENTKATFQRKNSETQIYGANIHRMEIDPYLDKKCYEAKNNKFERRLVLSDAESIALQKYSINWDNILRIHIFHTSHAVNLVLNKIIPLKKIILHPMMTGKGYQKYTDVPETYLKTEKEVYKKIHFIQTPSADEKNNLTDFYDVKQENVIINHRGFSETDFVPKERSLPKQGNIIKILCANVIRPQKSQHLFIPFAEHCREHNIPISIQLIGVNSNSYDENYRKYTRELLAKIKEKKLENFFQILNVMNNKELNLKMQSSHVSIITSMYETFGKSALESSATGLPTIVFNDIPAFHEYVDHEQTGLFASRDENANELFKTFKKLLNNPFLYNKISRAGIQKGEKYQWTSLFNQMEDDYKSFIS